MQNGYTRDELAKLCGCSAGLISQIEAGKVRAPNIGLGLRLADKLGVDPHYLWLGDGSRMKALAKRISALERWRGEISGVIGT
jgi:transcriptional regulator with XRE-family HTH domain